MTTEAPTTHAGAEDVAPAGPSAARVWAKRLLIGLATIPLVLGLGAAALVAPYVLDDQRLDAIVMAVALDWRDFGEDKARTRLQYELDAQVGLQVGDDDCVLQEIDGAKSVGCAWSVEVVVPFTEWRWPLSFASEATVGRDGDLR